MNKGFKLYLLRLFKKGLINKVFTKVKFGKFIYDVALVKSKFKDIDLNHVTVINRIYIERNGCIVEPILLDKDNYSTKQIPHYERVQLLGIDGDLDYLQSPEWVLI